MNDINSEIDRLNTIINDLLTLVKIDTEEVQIDQQPVDLVELVKNTLRGLQILAQQKHISLEAFYDDDLTVSGDTVKLQQVISNIVDNAIKYTPDGGRVTVEVYENSGNAVVRSAIPV